MAKRDEFELRVVESLKPLPARQMARPVPRLQRRSAPTRAEALEALRATKGAASVLEVVPMLSQTALWIETAYWSVCKTSGAARGGVFLWDCDFPGDIYPLSAGYENCIAYFAGGEDLAGITPPDTLTGQVWCYLDAPADGTYVFVAQLETYLDEYYGPDYLAVVECFIDSFSFGSVILHPGYPVNQPFVAKLSAGHHQFQIKQLTGAFFFGSLTAYQIAAPGAFQNPVFEQ